jgi:hypothetical protein
MKAKGLDHVRLSRNLGSKIQGRVSAGAGFFGALQLAESVRRRFRPPASGGRARDPKWTMKRLIPVRPETLARLEKLAAEVSDLVDYRVEPLQVAAILLERDLQDPSERDLVEVVAAAGPRRSG